MSQHSLTKHHPIAAPWRMLFLFGKLFSTCLGLAGIATIAAFVLKGVPLSPSEWFNGAAALSLLVIGVSFYPQALKNCIITSPTGLEYHGYGLHLRTTWKNTEKIGLNGAAAKWGVGAEVIFLREPPDILFGNWFARLTLKLQGQAIPLAEFGRWRHSELRQEIRRYAPWLLR